MKKQFYQEVQHAMRNISLKNGEILNKEDVRSLPVIVQKYLENSGVFGKEKVINACIEMEGIMWSKPGGPGMKIKSVQYNFFDPYSRFFYIKAFKMGVPAVGLHVYKDEKATMKIKLAGLFTIADAKGPEMNQGETVTILNDMCFMAPATLISKNISWEILEPTVVKANFTNGDLQVSAILYFNEDGNILNFISNDRFETTDGRIYKNYPWSTPVTEFGIINGNRVPVRAKAIYHHPEGEFCYAEFIIKNIRFNT